MGVNLVARYPRHVTMRHVQDLPVGTNRHCRRPALKRQFALGSQRTGPAVQPENQHLVLVLQGHVNVIWHGSTSFQYLALLLVLRAESQYLPDSVPRLLNHDRPAAVTIGSSACGLISIANRCAHYPY